MSYASAIGDLGRYARTRFGAAVYLPLALFLCVAAGAIGDLSRPATVGAAMVLALTLVFQFRLWDDLADRERDRREHPQRVLPRSAFGPGFAGLLIITFIGNLGLLAWWTDPTRVLVYLLLNGTALVWYQGLRTVPAPTARAHILLLKYPVFVYLLAGLFSGVGHLPLSMILVYLCFCIYELLHDPVLAGRGSILGAEMLALLAAPVVFTVFPPQRDWIAPLSQVTIALAAGVALIYAFRRYRLRSTAGLWNYTPFAVGFVQVLSVSVGVAR